MNPLVLYHAFYISKQMRRKKRQWEYCPKLLLLVARLRGGTYIPNHFSDHNFCRLKQLRGRSEKYKTAGCLHGEKCPHFMNRVISWHAFSIFIFYAYLEDHLHHYLLWTALLAQAQLIHTILHLQEHKFSCSRNKDAIQATLTSWLSIFGSPIWTITKEFCFLCFPKVSSNASPGNSE